MSTFSPGRPKAGQPAPVDPADEIMPPTVCSYGDRLDALSAALRRLLRIPSPDLPALATKIALVVDHEAGTLTGGEVCMAALKRDALQLASQGDSYS